MSAPNLAERLGFDRDERVAVIHCDDVGMCHAANQGAFEALANGPATCGSVMVPCPWFREAADWPGDFDLGVHLTLNAEWPGYRWGPVAGRKTVPSLCDDQGYFPRTTLETVQRARPAEVETELRAQIETALSAGIDVTHIDAHMGTAFFPPFIDVYAKLASEFRLPALVVRPELGQLEGGLRDGVQKILDAADRMEEAGIPVLDGFCADSLTFEPGQGLAHNRARLTKLKSGVSYLICHPAQLGDELEAITSDAAMRDFERRFYGGEGGTRAVEEENIRTIGMRALRDLVRGEA